MFIGRFVRERGRLSDAVHAALLEKAGIETARDPTLLRIFDAPDCDERGCVVSAAHVGALPDDEEVTVRGETLQRSSGGRPAKVYRHKSRAIAEQLGGTAPPAAARRAA